MAKAATADLIQIIPYYKINRGDNYFMNQQWHYKQRK